MDKVYKYETMVQANGLIRIPKMTSLAQQRVEIVIRPLQSQETKSPQDAKAFVEKWRGILKDADPDELKYQYLQEKYG